MHSLLLKNLKVADPQSPHHEQIIDLLIQDGNIAKIGSGGSLKADADSKIWEEKGAQVSPGWVDSLTIPSDPGHEPIESLAALSRAAVAGGITRLICYPNTAPAIDNSQMVHSMRSRSEALPVEMGFLGAVTQGAKGKDLAEVFDMHKAGALGFSDGLHALQSAGQQMRVLQYLQAFDGLWVSYPEELSLSQGGVMNEGITSTQLGMKGIPELSESTMAARLVHLLDYCGGRVHFQPMSSPKAIHILSQAKNQHPALSLGTSIFHLSLSDQDLETFDTHYKFHPPLRSGEQQKALRQALQDGDIDLICSGHQAQGVEEKQVEFSQAQPGALGLQTLFSLAYDELVRKGIIDLARLIELLSHNPRKIFGLPKVQITEGSPAELSIFHTDRSWTFDKDLCFSRARNSPFLHHSFGAQALASICKGELHSLS